MQDQVNMLLKIAFSDEYHNLDTNRRDVTQGRSKLLIVFFTVGSHCIRYHFSRYYSVYRLKHNVCWKWVQFNWSERICTIAWQKLGQIIPAESMKVASILRCWLSIRNTVIVTLYWKLYTGGSECSTVAQSAAGYSCFMVFIALFKPRH